MSVSGLILPKAVFDLHVSVSCLFGPKDANHLSYHVHGKHFRNNVSVRFYSGKLLTWIKCQCQCQVWTPRNLIWQICAEHGKSWRRLERCLSQGESGSRWWGQHSVRCGTKAGFDPSCCLKRHDLKHVALLGTPLQQNVTRSHRIGFENEVL